MDLRAGLDAVVNRKIPSPRREPNPDHPIVQPVASRYAELSTPEALFNRYCVLKTTEQTKRPFNIPNKKCILYSV
jgi:hypothetical protein